MNYRSLCRGLAASLVVIAVASQEARAADAVTIVLREGQRIQMNYGYRLISEAFKNLDGKSLERRVLEFSLEGGSFLIDLSEVVIVCRDQCAGLDVVDPRSRPAGSR